MSESKPPKLELDFPWSIVPQAGESIAICEGIEWCRLDLPFALNHVNCWLLGDKHKPVVIDTGVNNEQSKALWCQYLSTTQQLNGVPVIDQLLVTHFHPDHIGLAGWFFETNPSLMSSDIEMGIAHDIWPVESEEYGTFYASWYTENGLPVSVQEAARRRGNSYQRLVRSLPGKSAWQGLREGQKINLGSFCYEVMIGRGHSPDMLMLYREEDHVLIAADQILPGISPNVSVMPKTIDTNPLLSFLTTLERLKQLPEDTLVLPSHGAPFRGLRPRIQALERHHEQRLESVENACATPQTAYELFAVLFQRELDAQQMSFALGESLAHLHYLEQLGRITRQVDRGIMRFRRS